MLTYLRWLAFGAALAGSVMVATACGDTPVSEKNNPVATRPADSAKTSAFTSIAVEPSSLVLGPGAKLALTVKGTGKDQAQQDITHLQGIAYASNSPDLVNVGPDGIVSVSSKAVTGSRATVTVSYQGMTKEIPVTVKYSLADTVTAGANGLATVTNPADLVVVVNKQRALPADYVPSNLVEPKIPFSFKEKSERKLMRPEAAAALEQLFAQAAKDNIKLYGVSAYRSYATQKSVFSHNVKTQGEKEASQYSARPGTSEHQTGLAIDVSSPSANLALEETFGNTPEGKWLAKNAPAFGFIIRYPKGKEAITGYAYEPWHIRYVGVDAAKEISSKGITLEEYFQDAVPVGKQGK
jgi:D-alanyl-D-alanine carboxypeptidase